MPPAHVNSPERIAVSWFQFSLRSKDATSCFLEKKVSSRLDVTRSALPSDVRRASGLPVSFLDGLGATPPIRVCGKPETRISFVTQTVSLRPAKIIAS